ncbi:hypothetical protein [Nocardioides sp. URHA0020]|uniref:hypothetical protein n=1 Tax=Nocardioides sp. URHA0020 TaxID=1380392 RepID=UPI000491DEB7|nr:hypothetical protein [Nocardioides sp. URHA0020]
MSAEQTSQPDSRLPRRFLIGGSAAVAAVGVSQLLPSAAEAAPAATTWKLGGNPSVSSANFIGTKNVAALIFKTAATTNHPAERMRITPAGRVGIGTSTPAAALDARSSSSTAVRGATTSTTATAAGVAGISVKGPGTSGSSTSGSGVSGTSTDLYGLQGRGGYAGVRCDGVSYGAISVASASGSIGAYATGNAYGVYGSGATYGIYGTGSTYGLFGSAATGVYGSGTTEGITGTTSNVNGNAVHGTGGMYGVHGDNARTAGVRGDSGYVGVWAQAPSFAMYAECTATSGQNYAVFAKSNAASCFAVFAQGNAHVNGTLSKAAGSFKIDHPLAPEDKWLSHSFVESPDMMNVYNGNVTLDDAGEATVELPDYFGALNRDFRYQLTCIGGYAPVYVATTVTDNAFSIAGGSPGLEVSWQVTGVRQDDYAREHPIVVETAKSKEHVGTRQFVPAGSGARLMRTEPERPTAQPRFQPPVPAEVPTLRS